MTIKTIQEAKKYIGKIVYTAHNFHTRRSEGKHKVAPLYIGGVHLFYNLVDYEIVGLELYENQKFTKGWGEIKLENIVEKFDSTKASYNCYYFAKNEAEKYCDWFNLDEKEKDKERAIETAKELLNDHKVKFEIFD